METFEEWLDRLEREAEGTVPNLTPEEFPELYKLMAEALRDEDLEDL